MSDRLVPEKTIRFMASREAVFSEIVEKSPRDEPFL